MASRVPRLLVYLVAVAFALFWIMPIVFVLLDATKSGHDFTYNQFWYLPREFDLFRNIAIAWNDADLGQGFLNSILYGTVGAAAAIFFGALAAYAMVALKVRRAFTWFLIIYSGAIFPGQMFLIPLFKLYNQLNLYDTVEGMLLFYAASAVPFCTFVLRNFFTTLSDEIFEAARIDGGSDFRIFWNMFLPLSKAALAVLFLFEFTGIWNDLLFGITLTSSPSIRPVMAALASLSGVYASTSMPVVLAGALVASLPTLVLFFGLQKHFLRGLTLSMRAR